MLECQVTFCEKTCCLYSTGLYGWIALSLHVPCYCKQVGCGIWRYKMVVYLSFGCPSPYIECSNRVQRDMVCVLLQLAMRRQDQELIKQLMSIRSTIQKLKRRQQEDWVSVSDSSESEDDCYGTPGSVPPSVLTPCTDRKRKLSSGGMNRLSAITRTRRPVPSSNGTTLALTDASGIRHSPPVHLKQYMKPKESSEDGRRHHRKGLETVNGRTD